MNREAKPEKTSQLSEGVKIALISTIGTIVAALIGGLFLLYSTSATSHSPSTTVSITPQPQVTSAPNFFPSRSPSTPTSAGSSTSTNNTPAPNTPTPTPTSSASGLSVYPSSVTFSSCLPKDNRTFAFNITNSGNTPISWTMSPGGSYSYNLLEQNGSQIIQGSPMTGNTIAARQTQAVLVSNILGNGVIYVSESGRSATHGINIICATSTSSSVYPQSVTFDSCSLTNARTFALSIINNSSSKLSWQVTNQVPTTSGTFSTFDGSGFYGTISPKQTEVVLVSNITANTIFIIQDQSHNTPFPISISCS
jgi:hypothetical protein